jgi:hypothetical protein
VPPVTESNPATDGQRPLADRKRYILRVESIQTETGEWKYRASYPELPAVSAVAARVLDAILDVEQNLDRYLYEDST